MPHQTSALRRAAALLESSGLRSNGWGRPGRAICMNTALAMVLGLDHSRLGRFGFHSARSNEVVESVGALILETRLLDLLPVPDGVAGAPRRQRPEVISRRRAVIELARWSDAPGRTAALAAEVLRDRAQAIEGSGFGVFRDTTVVALPAAAVSRELALVR